MEAFWFVYRSATLLKFNLAACGTGTLVAAIWPLLEARKAIEKQVGDLDRKVHRLARHDVQVRRFMTVPGVGETAS